MSDFEKELDECLKKVLLKKENDEYKLSAIGGLIACCTAFALIETLFLIFKKGDKK